ncbi:SDR family oxidoreductase [Companilactobacillus alimentarius]|uniref:Short-chain dehydrogenase/reductase n=1 Tax=Companilactobacillus alimentarius DSM 20249 TaxID=1423720 RepID=A0A2K9HHC1_9LACO|nr:SDR family NAD(P)-dependent oxidoreductase [Companilactobacillus alimentarius]AUI71940.1 short-chain dehydrogenase/reductase [Companilactobacillus alimentarius DSM 20249]KRK77886.1 short-chain dehydrogenase oxidoreductase [Companilactobacillus alimentarius DSM 20249]MDT6952467.1 SDR family NAD(P)-dependent oxidoreductase [Companilactobacillus alimentarius]GEO45309.1 short-chain dehydrogenase/reductase [Companilactobacillus alimentarius]
MTKTWLITGTSSGFGKELAQVVASKKDTNLVAAARKMSDLDYLDQYDSSRIEKVIIDVTDQSEIKAGVSTAKEKFGTIDVLVNNAGLGYFSTIEESNMDQVRYMFEVNVFGLANMTKAVLPIMRAQKSGVIVNLSSALALTTLPTMGFYSATKYAVEGYSDTLRQEVTDLGIQVMNVEPSGARTDWSGRSSNKVVPKISDYQQFGDSISHVSDSVTSSPGDPQKIAEVIYNQVENNEVIPKHLPLGQFAYEGGLNNLENLVSEIKSRQDISLSTDD